MSHFQFISRSLLASACVITACWSTEGPGLGPYSSCEQPNDCAARGEEICLQRRIPPNTGVGDQSTGDESGTSGGLEPLFCSHACAMNDPGGCPLARVDPELTPTCLAILDSDGTYCALVTESSCPDSMLQFTVDDHTVCVFSGES